MKKKIAAVGAAVLGLVAASAASGTAANAATTTPACTSANDQGAITATNPATASFYADCVPQYGAGKAEFTLKSAHDLSDYNLGNDEAYSPLAPLATQKYFGSESGPAMRVLARARAHAAATGTKIPSKNVSPTYIGDGSTDPNIYYSSSTNTDTNVTSAFSYSAVKITKVEKLTKASLSTKCETATKHYDGVYRFTFAPIDTGYQTTEADNLPYAGAPGSFHVTKAVPQLTVGVNFKEGEDSTDPYDHFYQAAPQCATFAGQVFYADSYDADSSDWNTAVDAAAYQDLPYFLDAGTVSLGAGLKTPYVAVASAGSAGEDATVTTTVKVGSTYQAGYVTVTVDGKRLKTEGALSGGKLTLTLPHTLKAGSHSAAIVFAGNATTLPTTITKTFTVSK